MADYDERSSDDLTEEPSAHRLEEMRRQGQVAQSRELTSTIVFLGALGGLYFGTSYFISALTVLMKTIFQKSILQQPELNEWLMASEILRQLMASMAQVIIPFFVVLMCLAVLGSILQTQGLIISDKMFEIEFDRLNPIMGFRKIYSLQGLQEGIKSIVKFLAVAFIVYKVLSLEFIRLPEMVGESAAQVIEHLGHLILRVGISLSVLMLTLSAADFGLQWWNMRKKAMMTKAEAKQDQKEREGDPQIRARIRSVQREMARKRMMKSVPKADVIITNPTHLAIAIVYEKELLAPKVVAKGADFLAEKIRAVAKENGIPIVENKMLARTLYKTVKVGQMIPRSLYQAVAEVLAYVYKLKPKRVLNDSEEFD